MKDVSSNIHYKDSNELLCLVGPLIIIGSFINFFCLQTFGIFAFAQNYLCI